MIAGLFFQSIFHQLAGWVPLAGLSGLLLLAAVRPYDGLLVLAGLGPLAGVMAFLAGAPPGMHFCEAMILAFVTGSAARCAVAPTQFAPPSRIAWTAAILIVVAIASGVVQSAVIFAEQPEIMLGRMLPTEFLSDYLMRTDAVTAALQFAEGPLLVLLVAGLCASNPRNQDRVLRMMVAGAAAAALFNILRIVMVWLQQPGAELAALFLNLRVNVQYGDLNAAGSYFAMMFVVAVGLVARSQRWAILWVAIIGAGLWISGSRTALAAAALTLVGAALIAVFARGIRRSRVLLVELALLGVVGVAAWNSYPHYRNDRPGRALATRIELAKAGLKMTARQPLFGVGLGRFRELSPEYTPVMLAVPRRENAHNNYVQVLAELGVLGLILLLSLVGLALAEARRAEGLARPSWGLILGLVTFLVTWLSGHPLLVQEASHPFWIALGLAAAPVGRSDRSPIGKRTQIVAAALVLLFVITVPLRIRAAVRQAHLENTSIGLSRWQRTPDGLRYRLAGGRSMFFFDSAARAVRIPLRHASQGTDVIEVRIFLNGREADRVRLQAGEPWRTIRLLRGRRETAAFSRVELEARVPGMLEPLHVPPTDTAGVLMVGQPIPEY